MTAKPSQRGNDDSEVLKFKDFQGPLTSNSKTFKALFHFQGLSGSWKNGKKIQGLSRTFKTVWPPWGEGEERGRKGKGPPCVSFLRITYASKTKLVDRKTTKASWNTAVEHGGGTCRWNMQVEKAAKEQVTNSG